jgi:hypothetical protein
MKDGVDLGARLAGIHDGQAAMVHDLRYPLGDASMRHTATPSEAYVFATEEGGNAGRIPLDADKPRCSVGSFVHSAHRKAAAESRPGGPGDQTHGSTKPAIPFEIGLRSSVSAMYSSWSSIRNKTKPLLSIGCNRVVRRCRLILKLIESDAASLIRL